MENEKVKKALELIRERDEDTLSKQLELCVIPAPSGMEEKRAAWVKEHFLLAGLEDVKEDELHNVTGIIKGTRWPEDKGEIMLASHTDTVFPEGTDLTVCKEGDTYFCPSIGDDTRGVAELVSIAESMVSAGIRPEKTIVFCANVCEEGLGNLKGIRHIFKTRTNIEAFVSIDDGTTEKIIYGATGSLRYEIRFTGPGGHSFGAFGIPNPIHAMGRAIAKISRFTVPKHPKTTFNVGVVSGGTTVNTIPSMASMLVDLRSGNENALNRLADMLKRAVSEAAEEENIRWNGEAFWKNSPDNFPQVTAEFIEKGNRPGGCQTSDALIVQAAEAAVRAVGMEPALSDEGSTDSNIPISLGIPAITVGMGGIGGGEHTPGEWYQAKDAWKGVQKNMLLLLLLAGLED